MKYDKNLGDCLGRIISVDCFTLLSRLPPVSQTKMSSFPLGRASRAVSRNSGLSSVAGKMPKKLNPALLIGGRAFSATMKAVGPIQL